METKPVNMARIWISGILGIIAVMAVVLCSEYLGNRHYYISGVLIIIIAMIPFFLGFERRKPSTREIVTLAVMCAIAVASRTAFIMVPFFKPMLGIIMITGFAFGPAAGFLTGAISAIVSNFIFGQGPWTPWQMFAYGLAGFIAGAIAIWLQHRAKEEDGVLSVFENLKSRVILSVISGLLILCVIGPILDTCTVFTMASMVNTTSLATVYLAGVPVNAIHGLATGLTVLLVGKPILEKLQRVKIKYGMDENVGK